MIDLGTRTLFRKEVRRFLRVYGQTLLAPVVTTALYVVVFGFALGGQLRGVRGLPYLDFIAPGLIILGVVSNAFLNTASSMMVMKIQGTIVDILVTPLRHADIVGAMVGAAAVRALVVGALTWGVAVVAGARAMPAHPVIALAVVVLTAVALAGLGLLSGIWAEKFEQVNVFPTFVVTPLVFVGGVFYDVALLPPALRTVSHLNPIVYLVEGLRFGLTGQSLVDPYWTVGGLAAATAVILVGCTLVVKSGWRLRG